jgi:hypothetical protein
MIARIIATAIFGGFGIVLLVVGVRNLLQQRRFLSNPRRIEVTIVKSEIKKLTTRDTKHGDLRDTSTNSYRPILEFSYEIDGKQYQSDLLRPSEIVQDFASQSSAADVLAPYPLGKTVQAYYQPSAPEKAFLIAEASAGPWVFIVLGALLGPIVWFVGKWIF